LTFASLVLAAGTLADRFGRREALLAGLAVYAVGNGLAALTTSTGALIATGAVMGLGAAIIFPTTVSILTNVFTERRECAQAIGLWGAVTGMAIALRADRRRSALAVRVMAGHVPDQGPLAIAVGALVLWVVPTSHDPETPPVDRPGLVLSTAGVAALVFTLIDAPDAGWAIPRTLGGFVARAAMLSAAPCRRRGRRRRPRTGGGVLLGPGTTVALFKTAAASDSTTVTTDGRFDIVVDYATRGTSWCSGPRARSRERRQRHEHPSAGIDERRRRGDDRPQHSGDRAGREVAQALDRGEQTEGRAAHLLGPQTRDRRVLGGLHAPDR
jgi:MFS family permease